MKKPSVSSRALKPVKELKLKSEDEPQATACGEVFV